MKAIGKICPTILLLCTIFAEISFAQERNPTTWPYGGVPDSSRYEDRMGRVPLNFAKANFDSAIFDSAANFRFAQFEDSVNFSSANFNDIAEFSETKFNVFADFSFSDFANAVFEDGIDFHWTRFVGLADFSGARFSIKSTKFNAFLEKSANFKYAHLDSVVFEFGYIGNDLHLGSDRELDFRTIQKVDLTYANLSKDARIVLWGPVQLIMQKEKIKHLDFGRITWAHKWKTLTYLKTNCFKNQKEAGSKIFLYFFLRANSNFSAALCKLMDVVRGKMPKGMTMRTFVAIRHIPLARRFPILYHSTIKHSAENSPKPPSPVEKFLKKLRRISATSVNFLRKNKEFP